MGGFTPLPSNTNLKILSWGACPWTQQKSIALVPLANALTQFSVAPRALITGIQTRSKYITRQWTFRDTNKTLECHKKY